MINITDLDTFFAYFKNLAEQNTTLLHNDDNNITFGVVDMITNQVSATIKEQALVIEYPEIGLAGGNENQLEDYSCAFWLIKKAPQKDHATIHAILSERKALAKEIIARLLRDYMVEEIEDFQLDSVRMNKLGPWSNSFYGWRVELTITAKSPLPFNPTKWNDIA